MKKLKNEEKIIVIGGGVGPMAGVELHKKIIQNTRTNGTDQEHFEIYHLSRSQDLPDRTDYLLKKVKKNPAEGMFRTVKIAQKAAQLHNKNIVFGVPCNTFHSAKIFDEFLNLIHKEGISINVIHMLYELSDFIKKEYPAKKKIGLLSTTGTRISDVYKTTFNDNNFQIIEVPQGLQNELHNSIYNRKWGIKAVSPVSKKARNNFLKYADILIQNGAEIIIRGCTEIPLALPEKSLKNVLLIDPVLILAKALIKAANPEKVIKQ